MPKIEIKLETSKENNELGEIMFHQQNLQQVSNEIARLMETKNASIMGLNRVVRSAIDRAKIGNSEIREIQFPPYIWQDRALYTIIDGVLGITMPDQPVPKPEPEITVVKGDDQP
jgi:hypothetical protein